MDPKSIVDLPRLVAGLPAPERELFERIFHLSTTVGQLRPPESMFGWIEGYFGSVEAVRRQRIVKLTNRVTLEGTLYNELRASRPQGPPKEDDLEQLIAEGEGGPFCRPLQGTPEDVFGRVQGQHCVTASNIAKYDGFHGLVIFEQHHPLRFDRAAIADYLEAGRRWAEAAHQADPQAVYYLFMWNCLWKSGASILHGHAQTALGREMHYARVEALRQAAQRYRAAYGSDYFADLLRVQRALGLSRSYGPVEALAYLTPIKEREVLLLGPAVDDDFVDALYAVLQAYVQRLGVRCFNLVLYLPPLAPVPEDWSGFPGVLARLVDRGDPNNRTADVGAMELYASSVVSGDPFRLVEAWE
ncbi:MAG: hypothetical protein JXA37_01420 [Chloroflexia bacterium]|nr:hypothetical protein [Chloroflexia bacterium]